MICSKIVIFDHTEAGLTSNWDRISPAVLWCYQNQSNYIVLGFQKDRYRGTGGTKEDLSSIGRFRKQQQMLFILAPFYAMWK